jgi:hypothetical protein
MTMKLAEARKFLKPYGIKISGTGDGEWRVTFNGLRHAEAERKAYYTTSMLDAIQTGVVMATALMPFSGSLH